MKKILITGANGYLGARLSKLFSLNGYSISGLCYPEIPNDPNWKSYFTELYNFDIRDTKSIELLSENKFDVIINLISLDHNLSEGDANLVTSVNVTPTLNLLKNFSYNKTVEKFINFSTIHIYGKLPYKLITENQTPNPSNVYGLTHHLSEQICNYFNKISDISCINVRLSNSYGSPVFSDNNCWWLVINDLCKTAFYNKKIVLKSDGTPQRDFIHGDDVFNALECIVSSNGLKSEANTLHIVSGNTMTILEIAHKIKNVYLQIFKEEIPVYTQTTKISEEFNNVPIEKYTLSNSKIKELGFSQKVDLVTGIKELFNYFHNLK